MGASISTAKSMLFPVPAPPPPVELISPSSPETIEKNYRKAGKAKRAKLRAEDSFKPKPREDGKARRFADVVMKRDTLGLGRYMSRSPSPALAPSVGQPIQMESLASLAPALAEIVQKGKENVYGKKEVKARGTFDNLPLELVDMVIGFSDRKYPWLTVCKRTTMSAAAQIYSDPLPINYVRPIAPGDDDENALSWVVVLEKVVRGLEHDGPSPDAPFGRDLKLAFLKYMTVLDDRQQGRIEWNPSIEVANESADNLIELFQHLEVLSIEPFPSVHTIHIRRFFISNPSSFTLDHEHLFMHSLAAITRPRYFQSCMGYTQRELEFREQRFRDVRFAGGHRPVECVWAMVERHNPPVCYGSHNIVLVPNHIAGQGFDRAHTWAGSVLVKAHDEHNWFVGATFGPEERKRREGTTWTFSFRDRDHPDQHPGYLVRKWTRTEVKDVKEAALKRVMPMEHRVRFSHNFRVPGGLSEWMS
ncbi:hypothetical protein IAT38_006209 [Cryptococcus sp. DSM 104549]